MSPAPVEYPLDLFLPKPDVRERFETEVHAPADVVLDVARGMELGSLPLVRAIFRAREILMRTRGPALARTPAGILEETLALGWCVLLENERVIVVGARCQPWEADVTFSAIPPEAFAHRETGEMPLHTVRFGTVTRGELIVIRTWSLTAGHGPAGSLVVNVSVTLPAEISEAEGV